MTLSTMRVFEPDRRDHAGGHRAREAVRVADRHHELADAEPLGVAELGGRELAGIGAEDSEVGERVRADDLVFELATVGERDAAAPVAPLDDVRRGQQVAVGRDHDAAPGARQHPPAPDAARHPEVSDRLGEPLDDAGDGARVRVERLLVVGRPPGFTRLLGLEQCVHEGQSRHPEHRSSLVVGCAAWPRSRSGARARCRRSR
jgi:hypothetical protein